jgi:hypothetical protein
MNFNPNLQHIIVTFPRSGAHYLQDLFHQKTGFEMSRDHKSFGEEYKAFDGTDHFIVSVIREPRETFKSMYAMDRHYAIEENIAQGLPEDYCKFNLWLSKRADVLISYKDLVDTPDKVVLALANKLSLEVKDVKYVSRLKDRPRMKHLISSKTSQEYDKVDLSSLNFRDADKMYEFLLSQCIKV